MTTAALTMASFQWSTEGNKLPAGFPGDGWCVRDAFCALFRWPIEGKEWLAFIECPDPRDMDLLPEHLGLESYLPAELTEQHLDHPGVTCFNFHAAQLAHVLYQPHLRFPRPLPTEYRTYRPQLFLVLVDVRQRPHSR